MITPKYYPIAHFFDKFYDPLTGQYVTTTRPLIDRVLNFTEQLPILQNLLFHLLTRGNRKDALLRSLTQISHPDNLQQS